MKTAITILSQPDGKWHWVLRLWKDGPTKVPNIYSAKRPSASAVEACIEAEEEIKLRQGIAV